MKRTKKLSHPIYNLLINHNLDRFTVTQARDVLQQSIDCFDNANDARKYVYRQVNRLVSNGYLKTVGNGRAKQYIKTEAFNLSSFSKKMVKKYQCETMVPEKTTQISQNEKYIETLQKERIRYKSELSVTFAEEQEYCRLMSRFPDKKELLMPIYTQAKERSETTLGKINALTSVLNIVQNQIP
ncbi:hypothetical protein GT901_20695 [Vibrio parahaemolyticus]|uniref:hypothetical protein n=2 Tax=Vibrio TaxID=662 RepID=UPI0004463F03|nr:MULTISPECIES: hypothetical protein [Vibrio harveyi group]EGQ8276863.1 hypothetical protein [Vibrio parahaemolyticus]EJG0872059.1 hypothetical protein [Vibrio parahaemolyticus O3]EJG0900718.1 hypothetical protein [Vibrio parahaemolyticus O3:K56]EJG1075386.1 hypothetical protein [Vibrio parahaemolyticus O1:K56]EGQ8490197.1 hypothetical protein [Vibrio alginolyticus]